MKGVRRAFLPWVISPPLSGVTVMVLAIANRELAQQGSPEMFPPDDQVQPKQPPFLQRTVQGIQRPARQRPERVVRTRLYLHGLHQGL